MEKEKILDLFSGITEDDGLCTLEEFEKQLKPLEVDENIKKTRKSKTKKEQVRFDNIPNENGVGWYSLGVFTPEIISSSTLHKISIQDKEYILKDSWNEALGLLIGAFIMECSNQGKDVSDSIINSGIQSAGVRVYKEQDIHLDSEVESTSIFKLNLTDYYMEIIGDCCDDIYNGIEKALIRLRIPLDEVRLLVTDERYNVDNSENYETYESTLAELQDFKDIQFVEIESVSYIGATMEAKSFDHAVFLILLYVSLTSSSLEDTKRILQNYTTDDVVGVTIEKFRYLGIMDTMELTGTGLYFYSNGEKSKCIKYLASICDELGVSKSFISFRYKIYYL